MNVVKSDRKEGASFSKKIGIGLWKVLCVNPDKQELEALLGVELDKNPEYLGESKDGDKKITVNFWLEEEKSGAKLPLRFSVIDKERVSQSGKPQFINSVGSASFSDSIENLSTWFTDFTAKDKSSIGKKVVREALIGEEELYSFLRAWIASDYFNPETNIFLDNKKLFKENLKEIKDLIGTDNVGSVIAMAAVRIVDGEGGTREYNQISTKAFLPSYKMKMMNNCLSTDKWSDKGCISFKEALTGEYGEKGVIKMGLIEDYNATDHLQATNEPLQHSSQANDTDY